MRFENHIKEIHFSTKNIPQKKTRRQPKIKTEMTGIIYRFRGHVWKRAVHSEHKLRRVFSDIWIDVGSTVDGVYGNQEGSEVGYNSHKKGQRLYHPLIVFVAEAKENSPKL